MPAPVAIPPAALHALCPTPPPLPFPHMAPLILPSSSTTYQANTQTLPQATCAVQSPSTTHHPHKAQLTCQPDTQGGGAAQHGTAQQSRGQALTTLLLPARVEVRAETCTRGDGEIGCATPALGHGIGAWLGLALLLTAWTLWRERYNAVCWAVQEPAYGSPAALQCGAGISQENMACGT